MNAAVYIHGKNGSAEEAEHYKPLLPSLDVIGLEYEGSSPWTAGKEIHEAILALKADHDGIAVIANSIGAFFAMHADIERLVSRAFFISPVVDMERLIADMMRWAGITEAELRERGTIRTGFGEELSWEVLSYVRSHTVSWSVPTDILYGGRDSLTSLHTITAFAKEHNADLTVMEDGEHWFHTEEQMRFLDEWMRRKTAAGCPS